LFVSNFLKIKSLETDFEIKIILLTLLRKKILTFNNVLIKLRNLTWENSKFKYYLKKITYKYTLT
jgi:hypothetical protein